MEENSLYAKLAEHDKQLVDRAVQKQLEYVVTTERFKRLSSATARYEI